MSHSDPLPTTVSVLKSVPSSAATDFPREVDKYLRDPPGALVCYNSLKRAKTRGLAGIISNVLRGVRALTFP